ncbi:DUF6351 family protein [Pseudoruegeria sp. HB172150]|uniref:DUF6351 family protein n=1 Tax=Pseudoruegeria sp. HB172150 TaxID=2721164 RepID=UPI0015561694|nr:DUF6351 family protein [Pseudoruegeria sp. HB172150]
MKINPLVGPAAVAAALSLTLPLQAQNRFSFTSPDAADFATPVSAAKACDTLNAASFEGVSFLKAETAEVDGTGFCRVTGIISPAIEFEISLPDNWNRRLYMFGNGGYAGEDLTAASRVGTRDMALTRGFLTVQQNTGHDARTQPLGSFADGDLAALVDYAFRAVHETVSLSKIMAASYYTREPAFSYWDGCSTGGRQGLMSAQRFPGDFDGIVAGAPVLDFTGTQLWGVYNAQMLDAAPISEAQLGAFAEAVMGKCDAIDGVEDGLITDPRQCDFDPAADLPKCEGEASDSCFTPEQAEAIGKINAGVFVEGEQIFPGVPWGVEGVDTNGFSGWNQWIVNDSGPSRQGLYGETFVQNMALLPARGTDIDWRSFDIAGRYGEIGMIREILDATDPDLSAFRDKGGKLITYFGWADPALNPMMGVNYYESVRAEMGEAEVPDFYRLFMVPGMFHCRTGYGPDKLDALTPLIDWVENGVAPETIVAVQEADGAATRESLLCPYPSVAVYDGEGDAGEAASHACEMP